MHGPGVVYFTSTVQGHALAWSADPLSPEGLAVSLQLQRRSISLTPQTAALFCAEKTNDSKNLCLWRRKRFCPVSPDAPGLMIRGAEVYASLAKQRDLLVSEIGPLGMGARLELSRQRRAGANSTLAQLPAQKFGGVSGTWLEYPVLWLFASQGPRGFMESSVLEGVGSGLFQLMLEAGGWAGNMRVA